MVLGSRDEAFLLQYTDPVAAKKLRLKTQQDQVPSGPSAEVKEARANDASMLRNTGSWAAALAEDTNSIEKTFGNEDFYKRAKRTDSAIARFKAMDINGDGYISKKEMDMVETA